MRPPMKATPTTRISLVKSPFRRKEITRKETKKIIAVPKSPIRARQTKQNPEKIMKIRVLRFSISSSREAAPTQM